MSDDAYRVAFLVAMVIGFLHGFFSALDRER